MLRKEIALKLLFLTNLLSPYRVEWLNGLTDGNEIDAFFLAADEKTREQEWLSSRKPCFHTEQLIQRGKLLKSAPDEFYRRIIENGYDIYIVDGYSSPIKLKTIKTLLKHQKNVFINIDGIDVWREKSASDIVKDSIKKRVFRSGAYFLCGSKIAAKTVIEGGADKSRVFVHPFTSLHQGDLITFAEKQSLRREYKQKLNKADQKIALAVGRFIPLKQYDRLIGAWENMPGDCYLYIIGGGEERANYEALIRSKKIANIELIDFIHPEKLREYFCAADLFVHTSSTETWGLVLNEAMAAGCPVIATDHCVGGVELIDDGKNGYLIKAGDVADLHEKMQKILTDDALRDQMAQNAIDTIAPYTYENLAATHLKIFRQIMR